jgi:tRNA(Ile)-lysidine synthase
MTFNTDRLLEKLAELQDAEPLRYLVAFSGGLDSTVLLHALAQGADRHRVPVTAVHIDHGLHPESPAWARHCRRVAEAFGCAFLEGKVIVAGNEVAAVGLEAAAREARYAALRELMRAGDVLLSAHHQEDQAETVLLNLMRGSGLAGVAGIGAAQPFGAGLLLRPLLNVARRELLAYAGSLDLEWLDDPANVDARFDRNFLRREIMPRLTERWPAAARRLQRSAELAAESAQLLDELATLDLAALGTARRLDIARLTRLSAARQRNVLRYAIRSLGLPPAPSTRLQQALTELVPARPDARPLVRWPGAELRRYRGRLYILSEPAPLPEAAPGRLYAGAELYPGPGLGRLRLEPEASGGLDPAIVDRGLDVRFRAGGERIRPAGREGTRPLGKLLQESGVVPWMRDRLPLLYAGNDLVAVADLWLAAEAVAERGYAVSWTEKPAIF